MENVYPYILKRIARRMARHVVRTFEDAPGAADRFIEQFKPRSHKDGETLRDRLVSNYRAACGGLALYEASKAFLLDNCQCKGADVTCSDCDPMSDLHDMPWCAPCRSYHASPTDAAHHKALQCKAAWTDVENY